jgi:hypothetical protein
MTSNDIPKIINKINDVIPYITNMKTLNKIKRNLIKLFININQDEREIFTQYLSTFQEVHFFDDILKTIKYEQINRIKYLKYKKKYINLKK